MSDLFWARVDKTGTPAHPWCWVWTGRKSVRGYGETDVKQPTGVFKTGRAHRFAYESLVEPVPAGLELDHLCRNRACVNPAHLEPVTHAENARRGLAGRSPKAQEHLVGLQERHRTKSVCKAGHPLAGSNLVGTTYRRCRECSRLHCAAQRTKRRARTAA